MGLFSFNKKSETAPKWLELTAENQLDDLIDQSSELPVVLFKHSTRCSVSSMVKRHLESNWDLSEEEVIPVYLDLIQYRPVSNLIAERFNVAHESPQIIILKNGRPIYNASHERISVDAIKNNI